MLKVLLLDTLRNESVSAILKNAYLGRVLPIKRLSVFTGLTSLSKHPFEQVISHNVFISAFTKPEEEYLSFAKKIKMQNDGAFIVFVVDRFVDISVCVKPSVRPSGILFTPPDEISIHQTLREIYAEYLRLSERETSRIFTVKSGSGYFSINAGEIIFFEAREKKIALKTSGQEILFYSNFETLLGRLPDWFIRCHKGFVVNTKFIASANFPEMTLRLRDNSIIPISRTYRGEIKLHIESKL